MSFQERLVSLYRSIFEFVALVSWNSLYLKSQYFIFLVQIEPRKLYNIGFLA